MELKRLTLQNFRNYQEQSVCFAPGVNLIWGENAQGKTNLLEAVRALSTMRLFRTGQKRDGLRFGAEEARVSGALRAAERDFLLELRLSRRKSMEVWRNGVRLKRQSDGLGLMQSVLFCPDDLALIRAGASARRRFLDEALCQLRPQYARALGEYNRLLEHKTRILRDSEEKPALLTLLDDFSQRMALFGAHIVRRRAKFIAILAEKAAAVHAKIAGVQEALTMEYHTVATVIDPSASTEALADALLRHALSHRAAEIAARSCLSGPHRDDLELLIDGRPAAAFASQGQVRTCALSLKLAERELFFEDCGEYPLLLLDDVLSELDPRRRDFVLRQITSGQVLITCCEQEDFGRAHVLHVAGGRIL